MSRDPHELATPYALDAVDDDERARFEEHLARCPECVREVAAAQEALVATIAPDEEPPAYLRHAALDAAARTPQEPVEELTGSRPRSAHPTAHAGDAAPIAGGPPAARPRRGWLAAAASLALVAAFGLGAVAGLAAGDGATPPTPAESIASAEMITLDGDTYERGALLRTDGGDLLVAYGLTPLAEGETYQAWVVRDEAPQPAGLFEPDDAGSALVTLDEAVSVGDVVLVTREPDGGADEAPTGPVKMRGEVHQ